MKTEQEIREEIEALKRTIENYRKAYNEGKIPQDIFTQGVNEHSHMILALKWVLGENERYD